MKITRKDFIALAVGTAAGCTLPPRNSGGRRWYKGMIHAHTCWSDGYALPEQAVAVYKNSGYDFFSITDHNRIGSDPDRWIRVAPLDGTWPPKTVEPSVFDAFKAAFPDAKWRMRNGKPEVRMSTMAEIAARGWSLTRRPRIQTPKTGCILSSRWHGRNPTVGEKRKC